MKYKYYSGFTLLELMVALALGLIVSAAAIQLFLVSQRNVTTQQGVLNIQNDSLFGVESIVRDIRLANLFAGQPYIDDTVLHGGIVLDNRNYTSSRQAAPKNNLAAIDIVGSVLSIGKTGPSNLQNQNSDQLVIQYKNIFDNQFDCEGRQIAQDAYVVQKYFLREDIDRNDPNQPLALACTAISYTGDTPEKIDLSSDGQILISRVDHFSVLLQVARDGMNNACTGTKDADGKMDCFGIISINDYLALTTKPHILGVKIGLLIRSSDTAGQGSYFDKNKEYVVLNTKAKLKNDDLNKLYLRGVVTQTIALRNGFGIQQ